MAGFRLNENLVLCLQSQCLTEKLTFQKKATKNNQQIPKNEKKDNTIIEPVSVYGKFWTTNSGEKRKYYSNK